MSLHGDFHNNHKPSISPSRFADTTHWTIMTDGALWSAPSNPPDGIDDPRSIDLSHFYQNETSGAFHCAAKSLAEQGLRGEFYPTEEMYESDPTYLSNYDTVNIFDSLSASKPAYPPSAYQLEPSSHEEFANVGSPTPAKLDFARAEYGFLSHQIHSEHSNSASDAGVPRLQPNTSLQTPQATELTIAPYTETESNLKDNTIDREQPYAQLIYRALMEAPNHTMVLRDIYNWFRHNTEKAQDKDTKGWQNSIRHNLSMNGAFQKVDIPPREDQKKGFMWRLTQQAIREGVKSTTRYRSKAPNKRGIRSHCGLPQHGAGARACRTSRKKPELRRSERLGKPTATSELSISDGLLPGPASSDIDTCNASCGSSTRPARPVSPYFTSPAGSGIYLQPEIKQESPQNYQFTTYSTMFPERTYSPSTPSTPNLHSGQSYPSTPASLPLSAPLSDSDFFQSYAHENVLFYNTPESLDEPKTPHSIRSSAAKAHDTEFQYIQNGDWKLGLGILGAGT